MKRVLTYSLASLLVCFCLGVVASPHGTTKKFVIRGHVEGKITAVAPDYSWIQTAEVDIGESNFQGRFLNTLQPTYLFDQNFNTIGGHMEGEAVAANRKGI